MAYQINFPHHLEIDGVPLSTVAWEHLNIQTMYSAPATRGENRIMPHAHGRVALPWRPDETMRTVTMVVFGEQHWDGTLNVDPVAGLWANLAHLTTNVAALPVAENATRTAVLKRPGAPDRTALVQVRGFEVTDEPYSPSTVGLSIDLAFLTGGFT